jgi:hypothetical protein
VRRWLDLGEEQSGLRVRLLVGLVRSLLVRPTGELRTTVDQALHIAREINDQVALCDALRIKAQMSIADQKQALSGLQRFKN